MHLRVYVLHASLLYNPSDQGVVCMCSFSYTWEKLVQRMGQVSVRPGYKAEVTNNTFPILSVPFPQFYFMKRKIKLQCLYFMESLRGDVNL